MTITTKTAAEKGRRCHACGEPRGKRTAASGWEQDTDGAGDAVWTCPACPRPHEPIRRMVRASGVRFRAVVDVGTRENRKQASKMFDNVADARLYVDEVRARVQSGTYSADTVAALATQWVESLTAAGMRKVTVQGYRSALRPLIALLGDMKVIDVRTSDIQRFVSWALREGSRTGKPLSPRSVKYALTAASQMFGRAVTGDVIAINPVKPDVFRRKVKAAAKQTGRDYWDRTQVDAFRAAADADPMAAAFRLSISGMTRSEVHGLTWDCVDLDAGTVTIRQGRVALAGKPDEGQDHSYAVDAPKTDQRWRTLPVELFEPGTVAALRSLKAAQAADRLRAGAAWQDSGFVIVDAIGRPEHPERYSERFRRLAMETGLPSIRLHALRHSLAHWFDSIGVPPSAGAAWLGHTTAVYLGTYFPERGEEGIKDVMERVEAWRLSA